MGPDNVIEGGVRYTRHGYRCRHCGFNFSFDFTSELFQCPGCGNIIRDKSAYYLSSVIRAIAGAFTILWLPAVVEFVYSPYRLPLISVFVFVFLAGILLKYQMLSLVISRVMYRAIAVLLIVALVICVPVFALRYLKVLEPDGLMLLAVVLSTGLILSVASLAVYKINVKTYDYAMSPEIRSIR